MTVMGDHGEISEREKTRIGSEFLLHAPPGEFNEVFNDVRVLLNSDRALSEGCSAAFAQYNKEQLVSAPLDGAAVPVLVSAHNDLGGGRFYDPRSGQAFRFDHLRREATEPQPIAPPAPHAESWRKALQAAADDYANSHYKVTDKAGKVTSVGAVAVFGAEEGGKPALTLCIESHKLEPRNYSNGRWRSEWSVLLSGEKSVEVKGVIRVQVHYYEDGNVQLVSSKEVARSIAVGDESSTARAIMKVVGEEEDSYQVAAKDRYDNMSKTTLKTLRRPLPITKTPIDWTKALGQGRVAHELRPV